MFPMKRIRIKILPIGTGNCQNGVISFVNVCRAPTEGGLWVRQLCLTCSGCLFSTVYYNWISYILFSVADFGSDPDPTLMLLQFRILLYSYQYFTCVGAAMQTSYFHSVCASMFHERKATVYFVGVYVPRKCRCSSKVLLYLVDVS